MRRSDQQVDRDIYVVRFDGLRDALMRSIASGQGNDAGDGQMEGSRDVGVARSSGDSLSSAAWLSGLQRQDSRSPRLYFVADPEGEGEIAGASNDIDTDTESLARLRYIILALILLSVAGLLVELVLLEHYDSLWQWTPLVLLGVALVSTSAVLLRPTRAAIRLFQAVMTLCIVAGALGLWLHYRGNVEFEIERDASLHGLALFWEALRGATPSLAPAAMAQLGLLGLAFAHRHPALRRPTTVRGRADIDPEETR